MFFYSIVCTELFLRISLERFDLLISLAVGPISIFWWGQEIMKEAKSAQAAFMGPLVILTQAGPPGNFPFPFPPKCKVELSQISYW